MGVSGCGEDRVVSGRLEGWVGLWWAVRLIVPPFVRLTAAKREVRARTRCMGKTYRRQEPWAEEAEGQGLGSAWG